MKVTKAKNINIKIDGKKVTVPEGISVLEAVRQKGIYIPTLCYLKSLEPFGGCRLCVVEIKNLKGYPTACTTPVASEMEIKTKSAKLQKLRKETLELILSEHPYTCLTCGEKRECNEFMHSTRKTTTATGCNFCTSNGDCELQDLVDYLDLDDISFPIKYRGLLPDRSNPFYDLDYNLCVLCGRCVRICNEGRNSDTLSFVQRGNDTLIGTAFGESQLEAGCEFCGACVDVCPTGSISEKMSKWVGLPEKSTQTNCLLCSVACSMNVNSKDDRIINIGPKPGERMDPAQVCIRGKFVPADINSNPNRIGSPMIKKSGKWIEVSWKEAIAFTARNLNNLKGRQFGIIGSAHDSIEDNYLLQKFGRQIMESNNVDLLSSYPEKVLLDKINQYYNTYSPPDIESVETADTILIIGANGSVSHPMIENRIRKASKQGAEVILVNQDENRSSNFASRILKYKHGEELKILAALLSGMLHNRKGKKAEELSKELSKVRNKLDKGSKSIDVDNLNAVTGILSESGRLIIIAGDGLLRGQNSVQCFNALVNLQLLYKEPENCSILFLLNDGNIFGSSFVGMNPVYLPGFNNIRDKGAVGKWSANYNTKLGNKPGLSANEMLLDIGSEGIRSLFVSGDIPPDKKLSELEFFVQQNMFLTPSSEYAHVFFPAASFMEAGGHIINTERKLKSLKRIVKPPEGSKTVWELVSALGNEMLPNKMMYKKTEDIFKEIKANTDIAFKNGSRLKKEFLPLINGKGTDKNETPAGKGFEYNPYQYRGNLLSDLIDDMKAIIEFSKND